ncbi:DHS-like NAD/FAD-binding domain-containing protein [Obelidium mucronatum]|nr:DHS-like NAD/FAD-binding domain-containing protein [Obelidium mucronatum]
MPPKSKRKDADYCPSGVPAKRRTKRSKVEEIESDASDDSNESDDNPSTTEYIPYADRLIQITDKGLCGDKELEETEEIVREKVKKLAQLIRDANGETLIHTGAGISTSAGVPDFRGPNGVWTRQAQGLPPPEGKTFGSASPTSTHWAITALVASNHVKHIVSQNVDGLHIRASLPRTKISEVHGTAFAEWCRKCKMEFRTDSTQEVHTIGLKKTGNKCIRCGYALRDMLCDWDSALPETEVDRAIQEHKTTRLVICVGTSLRVQPAGNWPLKTVKRKNPPPGSLVIVNLQKTHLDKQCAIRIFSRADFVFELLMEELGVSLTKPDK